MASSCFLAITAVYLTLSAVIAPAYAAVSPRSSPSPCTLSCPPQDNFVFALGEHSNVGGTLFCSYPAVEGEDPNDFFCRYSSADGHLIEDNDAGVCPATAVPGSGCATRRRMLERAQELHELERIKRETVGPEAWSPELKARYEEKWGKLKKRKQALGSSS